MKRIIIALFLSIVIGQLLVVSCAAAGSISVTPQLLRIDLATDPEEAIYTYKNTTESALELDFSIQDVKELEEIGIPGFVDPATEVYKYGLSSWATLSTQTILLEPGEEKSIKVIVDKTRLPVGGHYASVLAQIKQGENEKVSVKAVLAALLFVRAGKGFELEEGKIESLVADTKLYSFPEKFLLRFRNMGNVDVEPHGLIEVTDSFGRRVGKGIINEDSFLSLPETIRRFTVRTEKQTSFLLPGFYTAKAEVHFGKSNKSTSRSVSFFTLGSVGIKSIAVISLLFAAVVFVLLKLKRGRKKSHDTI